MIPDRRIVKRIKSYDPNLFVKWNDKCEYFELHMKHWNGGSVLITPITRSIYSAHAPKEFVELDERILMWIYHADTRRKSEHGYIETLRGWDEFEKAQRAKRLDDLRYAAKEMYHAANNFYVTKTSNNRTKTEFTPTKSIMKPDVRSTVRPRLFYRSGANAKAYNYRG